MKRPSSSVPRPRPYTGPRAVDVRVSRGRLVVALKDGRTLLVPLGLIPGFDALPRSAFHAHQLHGDGIAIYFPAIDESVSVENLLHPELTLRPSRLPQVVGSPSRGHRRSGSR